MKYTQQPMKLDQFISYVNDGKINLIPPFQRGHVWKLGTRRKLIQNILSGKPIPAVFLYREAAGEKYSYNILDGKQRLESIILFVGNDKKSLKVNDLHKYFSDPGVRSIASFQIRHEGALARLKDLDDSAIRDLKEYVIPIIEIFLDEESPSGLDEIISLFVDINSYGEKVKRFSIVKAMSKDRLLYDVFNLIAVSQVRGKDRHYKAKANEFTRVLKRIQTVEHIENANARVDKMWELMVEIVLFSRTKEHRTPSYVLKSFMRATTTGKGNERLTAAEKANLRNVFDFLLRAYRVDDIGESKLAKNQIHFYTLVTTLIKGEIFDVYQESDLFRRLALFARLLDGRDEPGNASVKHALRLYNEASGKHSTHVDVRNDREYEFRKVLEHFGF